MRFIVAGLICLAMAHTASAEGAAERSCGPADGERLENSYVSLNAPGYPAVSTAMDRLMERDPLDAIVPLAALGDFMQMSVLDLTLPGLELVCGFDMFAANECAGFAFVPSAVTEASVTGEVLSYATEDGDQRMWVEHHGRSFDRSVVKVERAGGATTSVWNRAADGTETLFQEAPNGDEIAYTENPDCSGSGHVIRHNENGLLTTNHFSWSAATGADFSFSYKICRYQEPDPGCHEGQL